MIFCNQLRFRYFSVKYYLIFIQLISKKNSANSQITKRIHYIMSLNDIIIVTILFTYIYYVKFVESFTYEIKNRTLKYQGREVSL